MPGYQSVPVVFLTGIIQEDELEALRRSGAAEIITKPFDPMTLADHIDGVWKTACGELTYELSRAGGTAPARARQVARQIRRRLSPNGFRALEDSWAALTGRCLGHRSGSRLSPHRARARRDRRQPRLRNGSAVGSPPGTSPRAPPRKSEMLRTPQRLPAIRDAVRAPQRISRRRPRDLVLLRYRRDRWCRRPPFSSPAT